MHIIIWINKDWLIDNGFALLIGSVVAFISPHIYTIRFVYVSFKFACVCLLDVNFFNKLFQFDNFLLFSPINCFPVLRSSSLTITNA